MAVCVFGAQFGLVDDSTVEEIVGCDNVEPFLITDVVLVITPVPGPPTVWIALTFKLNVIVVPTGYGGLTSTTQLATWTPEL